jgi:hypothetical protein
MKMPSKTNLIIGAANVGLAASCVASGSTGVALFNLTAAAIIVSSEAAADKLDDILDRRASKVKR